MHNAWLSAAALPAAEAQMQLFEGGGLLFFPQHAERTYYNLD